MREQRTTAIEDHDGVIAFSGRPDAWGEVKPPVGPEAESARKRDDGLRQKVASLRIEAAGIARIVC
jgi:hypothetical protein